jgi:hypothetical protein
VTVAKEIPLIGVQPEVAVRNNHVIETPEVKERQKYLKIFQHIDTLLGNGHETSNCATAITK